MTIPDRLSRRSRVGGRYLADPMDPQLLEFEGGSTSVWAKIIQCMTASGAPTFWNMIRYGARVSVVDEEYQYVGGGLFECIRGPGALVNTICAHGIPRQLPQNAKCLGCSVLPVQIVDVITPPAWDDPVPSLVQLLSTPRQGTWLVNDQVFTWRDGVATPVESVPVEDISAVETAPVRRIRELLRDP